jgi:hypothetical protein
MTKIGTQKYLLNQKVRAKSHSAALSRCFNIQLLVLVCQVY